MPRLEDWFITSDSDNPYKAPELRAQKLSGKIYDDETKRFEDGTEVITSTIVKYDFENELIQTKSTEYKLGKISDEYSKWLELNKISLEVI